MEEAQKEAKRCAEAIDQAMQQAGKSIQKTRQAKPGTSGTTAPSVPAAPTSAPLSPAVPAPAPRSSEPASGTPAPGTDTGTEGVERATSKLAQVKERLRATKAEIQRVVSQVRSAIPVISKIGSAASEAAHMAKKGFSLIASAAKAAYAGIRKVSGVAAALIQKFSSGIPVVGKLASAISNLGKKSESSAAGLRRLKGILAGVISIAALVKFGQSCLELGSDLTEVQNVVDTVFPHLNKSVNEFAGNAATSFGLSETMAKRYAGTFGAMAKAFGFAESNALEMSTRLTGLAGDVASFYNISQDEAYTKLKSVFTGETESLKDLGVVMTQAALDQYALANGFGKTTQQMSEAEKVSLRYAFVLEKLKAADGDFAKTQDSWANQVRILKLQLDSIRATIGQGLINVLTPVIKVINQIISKVSTMANAFKSFTELITGGKAKAGSGVGGIASEAADAAGGLNSAADAANNLAGATGKAGDAAAKAAKEALGLMAFDEINKLSDNSNSGSDSGSGSSGSGGGLSGDSVDYGDLAETTEETNALGKAMADAIQVFKNAWDTKGKLVVDSWKGALESVKALGIDIGSTFLQVWNDGSGYRYCTDILDLVADLGQGIDVVAASFKNAWDDNNNGYNYITSIFDKWNAVLELIHSVNQSVITVWGNGTGSEILGNWLQICTNINEAIANIASGFKKAWDNAGTGTSVVQNICDIINDIYGNINKASKGFREWTESIDFGPMLQGLNDALEAVKSGDFNRLGEIVGEGISGGLEAIDQFITWDAVKDTLTSVAVNLALFINGAISGTDWGMLGKIISDGLKHALEFCMNLMANLDFIGIGQAVADFLCGIDWIGLLAEVGILILQAICAVIEASVGLIVGIGKNIVQGLLQGITGALTGIGTWLWDNLVSPFINWLKDLFGIHSPSTVMAEIGGWLIEGFLKGITDFFSDPVGWIKEHIVDPFKEAFDGFFDNLFGGNDKAGGGDERAFAPITLSAKVETTKEQVKTWWHGVTDEWKDKTSSLKQKAGTKISEVRTWFSERAREWKNKTTTLKQNVGTKVGEVKTWFNDRSKQWKDKTSQLRQKVATKVSDVRTWFSERSQQWKDKATSLKQKAVTKVGDVKTWFSERSKQWKDKTGSMKMKAATAASSVKSWWSSRSQQWKDKTVSFGIKVSATANSIKESFKSAINAVIGWINSYIIRPLNSLSIKIPKLTAFGKTIYAGNTFGFNLKEIKAFKSGGFPEQGSLFVANEAGPEMIGTMGNRTTVANNQQITAGIAAAVGPAVYQAMMAALKYYGSNGGNVTVVLQGDAKKFFKAVQKEADEFTRTHNKPAFNM